MPKVLPVEALLNETATKHESVNNSEGKFKKYSPLLYHKYDSDLMKWYCGHLNMQRDYQTNIRFLSM